MRYLLIIILAIPPVANADEVAHLGRLFFTPAERASLDILRQNSKAPDKVITADDNSKDDTVEAEKVPTAINPVIMNGYIRRSDGKTTLWVDDRELPEKSTNKELSISALKNNQVKVTVNKNKSAYLKPGQVYDPNTGKVYDHASEAPQPAEVDTATPESAIDKVSKKIGLDQLKKKVSDLMDSLSAKPESSSDKAENK